MQLADMDSGCVYIPSYVFTASRFMQCRMTWYSSQTPFAAKQGEENSTHHTTPHFHVYPHTQCTWEEERCMWPGYEACAHLTQCTWEEERCMWPGYKACAHLTHGFTSACLPPSISLASLAASSAFPHEFLLISEIVSGANL